MTHGSTMHAEGARTLPRLDSPYPVSAEAAEAFRSDGHVCLRGVCDAEDIAVYRREILEATADARAAATDLSQRDTYGKAFLQMFNLWEVHKGCRAFVHARRFAQIAADLMGVDGVRLYHDQALFKEAGGGFTPWHQDQYYWPLDTTHTVTMWMPLVDITEEMGIMTFASRSHANGYLTEMGAISDKSEARIDAFVRERGYGVAGEQAMRAGDATFHYGWTLHRAGGNRTGTMREVMTIIYFADGTCVLNPDHPARASDLKRWLKGCEPGALACGPLNPLLYERSR